MEIQIPIRDLEELSLFIFDPHCFLKAEKDSYRTLSMTTCQYMILHVLCGKKGWLNSKQIKKSIKGAFNVSPKKEHFETAFDMLILKKLIEREGDFVNLTEEGKKLTRRLRNTSSGKYRRIKKDFHEKVKNAILETSPTIEIEDLDKKIDEFFDRAFRSIVKEYLYETYIYFTGEKQENFYLEPLQLILGELGDPKFHQTLEEINIENFLHPIIFSKISESIATAIAIDWIANTKIRKYLEDIRRSTWIFLDTNILISAICPTDIYNIPTNRILRYLGKLDFSFGITPWTYSEFEDLLEFIKKKIDYLATSSQEERIRHVTANYLSPVSTFFKGNFNDSSFFIKWIKEKLDEISKDHNIFIFVDLEILKEKLEMNTEDIREIRTKKKYLAQTLERMGKPSFTGDRDAGNISLVRHLRKKEDKHSVPYRNWIWSWDYTLKDYEKLVWEEFHPTVLYGYLIATVTEPFLLLMEEDESKEINIDETIGLLLSIPTWLDEEGFGISVSEIRKSYENEEQVVKFQRIQHAMFLVKNSGKKFISYLTKCVKKV